MGRDITSLPAVPPDGRVAYGPDASQFLDFWLARGASANPNKAGVVIIHGGFWRARYELTHASHFGAALAAGGFSTASLEYRRIGNGGGWPASFEDVQAGVRAACAHLNWLEGAIVIGHSAGGHLALRLASEFPSLQAVIALAPVACLALAYQLNLSNGAVVEFLGGSPQSIPLVYRSACASQHAASVPRVLIHGTLDHVVPIELSRCYVERRTGDAGNVRLIEIPDANHFDLIDPSSSAWPVVLDTVLKFTTERRM